MYCLSLIHISSVVIRGVGKNFIDVGWNRIKDADGYYIYRKTGRNGWQRIASVSGDKNTSYSDKSVSRDQHYYYTVRAYKGKTISTYSAGPVSYTHLDVYKRQVPILTVLKY